MKSVLRKGIFVMMLVCMVFTLNVFASDTGSGVVRVPENQVFVLAKKGIKRSGKYNYAKITANSVYPDQNYVEDIYTRCLVRLQYGSAVISSEVQLTEGEPRNITIKNSYLHYDTFRINFAGNHPEHSAYIAYSYDGK